MGDPDVQRRWAGDCDSLGPCKGRTLAVGRIFDLLDVGHGFSVVEEKRWSMSMRGGETSREKARGKLGEILEHDTYYTHMFVERPHLGNFFDTTLGV